MKKIFKLPNGKQIDIDMIELALEESSNEGSSFLNTQTGEVVFLSELSLKADEYEKLAEEIDGSNDYVRIDNITSDEEYRWRVNFATDIVAPYDERAAEKLLIALNQHKPFRHFKDTLHTLKEKWTEAWYHQREEYLHQAIVEWLEDLPVEITQE